MDDATTKQDDLLIVNDRMTSTGWAQAHRPKGHIMTQQLLDRTGAPVTVKIDTDRRISAYTVHSADGTVLGRADFIDSPDVEGERIFFHTEVDPSVSGRGLGGLLVRQALADSIRTGTTVVAVCPLFAGHLKRHGDEFVADGGTFRKPRPADLALVTRATQSGA